jgi:hypothetical protein
MTIHRTRLSLWYGIALALLSMTAGAAAQDSASAQPLGDVARQQKEQRQRAKPAQRVVTDEDIPANRARWIAGYAAEFKIIPDVRIRGLVPSDPASTPTFFGQKADKIYVGFGPHLVDTGWCDGPPECAEDAFLKRYQGGAWVSGSARILFDADDSVGDYDARVAHFEVLNNGQGKMLGTVALIQTPIATLMSYCIYRMQDRTEAEPECDAFISSLQVEIPKRFVYVHPQ